MLIPLPAGTIAKDNNYLSDAGGQKDEEKQKTK